MSSFNHLTSTQRLESRLHWLISKFCYFPGNSRFRFRVESATEAKTEAFQPADPGSCDVDPVSLAMLRGRQEFQLVGNVADLRQGPDRTAGIDEQHCG